MSVTQALQIPMIRQAFVGLLLAGGLLSLWGVMVISLNLSGLRFTLMHVGLLGAAVGMALGWNSTWGAFALILVVSGMMGVMGDRVRMSTNSLSGLFMTGSLALAFILLAKSGIPAMEVFGIFAGSILLLSRLDLYLVLILGIVTVVFYIILYREIQLVLLDKDLAAILGVPVAKIRFAMFVLLGAAVALALRLVGALLVDAVILLPAMAALPLARGLKSALALTSLFGIASAAGGFFLALALDLPVGASVAVMGTILLLLSHIVQRRM